MRTQNISIHYGSENARIIIDDLAEVYNEVSSFQCITIRISSHHPQDYSALTIFFDNLSSIIAFKNDFLSEFNKFMKDLGYDR